MRALRQLSKRVACGVSAAVVALLSASAVLAADPRIETFRPLVLGVGAEHSGPGAQEHVMVLGGDRALYSGIQIGGFLRISKSGHASPVTFSTTLNSDPPPLGPPGPCPAPNPQVAQFPSGFETGGVAVGRGGAVWESWKAVLFRISQGKGRPTLYADRYSAIGPIAIARDGTVWFLESCEYSSGGGFGDQRFGTVGPMRLGRISPAGAYSSVAAPQDAGSIALDAHGTPWISEVAGGVIARLGASGMLEPVANVAPGPPSRPAPGSLVAGPDGNMWFSEPWAGRIARISPSGALKQFRPPSPAFDLVVGPDRGLWFNEPARRTIASMDTRGRLRTSVRVPSLPIGLGSGADRKVWFSFYRLLHHPTRSAIVPGRIVPSRRSRGGMHVH
jgi:streptogramin lyase